VAASPGVPEANIVAMLEALQEFYSKSAKGTARPAAQLVNTYLEQRATYASQLWLLVTNHW
jgi:hypothetical protein